jgi:Family of unknown function (DUF6152)
MRIVFGLILASLTTAADAHHSPSGYAQGTVLELNGRIAEYEWANPHVYIHLDVATSDGLERWRLSANSPSILRREGWTSESLSVGQQITVTLTPSVNRDRHLGFIHAVTTSDGTELVNFDPEAFFAPTQEPESAPVARPAFTTTNLTGTWLSEPEPQLNALLGTIGLPQAELTAAGLASLDAFDEETMHPGLDCTQIALPLFMAIPSLMTIDIDDDIMTIRSDLEGVERRVHMSADGHDGVPESLHGHSIGRWDGDVLVVDTAEFTPNRMGTVYRVSSGRGKHLIERFELNPDGGSLTYSFVLEDPEYLATPISSQMRWQYRPDLEYAPVACDPENARRFTEE